MKIEEAKEILSLHSGYHQDVESQKWKNGFLGQLRPYQGVLHEENFLELVSVLEVFWHPYKGKEIEKETVSMLFEICTIPRLWAFDPEGMLRRNTLIDESALTRLNDWLIRLAEGVSYILNDQGINVRDIMVGYGNSNANKGKRTS